VVSGKNGGVTCMKPILLPTLLVALLTLSSIRGADSQALPRSAPETQGVSSTRLLAFINALDAVDTLNSVMVVRHGRVIAEGWWAPYGPQVPHEMYSLSKSFTATAVGIAAAEGKLSVDDEVLRFFPDDAPEKPDNNLKAMRIRDLLCMSTGHQEEPPIQPNAISARSFLAHPVPHKPGTHFRYNTAATFMQSAVVQKVTGETVLEYLRPRLFEPLGIETPTWRTNFQGISLGGYGLNLRTEDIAKFGQLYLQKGLWNGRRVLAAEWVEAATSKQTSNGSNPGSDWDQGYGFQFWRCRHGAYRGDGAFGQYCVVMPDQDAVVVITSGVKDMQGVLNLVWDSLLPAFESAALPENPAGVAQLRERLSQLSVRLPTGADTSPMSARVDGKTYSFPANDARLESLSIARLGPEGWVLTRTVSGVTDRLRCGYRRWMEGHGFLGVVPAVGLGSAAGDSLAATAAWTSDDTWTVRLCAYETPFYTTLRLRFEGDAVVLESQANVGFSGTPVQKLEGRAR